jgi:guanylate kinase
MKKGNLIVISAPSGCGKGTIIARLMKNDANLFYSVSATTRGKREGEIDGKNYYFISKDEFKNLIEEDGVLEYAEYVGNFYGTPKKAVFDKLDEGRDVILEIEVKGALQIKEKCPDAVMIFIIPPSIDELNRRLVGRNTESIEVITQRVLKAKEEIPLCKEYDYVVVNDRLEDAVADIESIIKSQKLKFKNMKEIISEVVEKC